MEYGWIRCTRCGKQYIIGTMLITGPFVLMTVVVYLIHVLSIAGGENQN